MTGAVSTLVLACTVRRQWELIGGIVSIALGVLIFVSRGC